jgi:hypothetical protein
MPRIGRGGKLVVIAAATLVSAALIAVYIVFFLRAEPSPAVVPTSSRGAELTLQTVASYGHAPHPDWVSYLERDGNGKWHHTTILQVPAHTLVHVTIYQYDTATGLRNPFWSQVRGTRGAVMTVNGKTMHALPPDDASHTFAIPDYGVSVPLKGVPDDAKNQCSVAPCTLAQAHTTITFTFRTGDPGTIRWQCFVPCAAAFIYGFGGPMQTIGWMDGKLKVV